MRDQWFRCSTWSEDDRAQFHARLKRARSAGSKAQYLRIQAVHLQDVGTPALLTAALELLALLIAEFPEPIQLAMAHQQQAEGLTALGRHEEAIAAYRAAFVAERRLPNVKTHAYLGFGELVLALGREELYEEASSILDEFSGDETFPVLAYRLHVVRALLSAGRDPRAARHHAQLALAAAAKTASPFRYHQTLGLVGAQKLDLEARLRALAS